MDEQPQNQVPTAGVYRDYDGQQCLVIGVAADRNGSNLAYGVKGTAGFWQGPMTDRKVVVHVPLTEGSVGRGMQVIGLDHFFAPVCHDEFCPDYGQAHQRGSYSHDELPRFTFVGETVAEVAVSAQ